MYDIPNETGFFAIQISDTFIVINKTLKVVFVWQF